MVAVPRKLLLENVEFGNRSQNVSQLESARKSYSGCPKNVVWNWVNGTAWNFSIVILAQRTN